MDTADSAKQTPNENLHATAVDELYHFAVNNFPKLDSDHNGYISKEELDNALQVGTYQGADAAKVRALRDHVDDKPNSAMTAGLLRPKAFRRKTWCNSTICGTSATPILVTLSVSPILEPLILISSTLISVVN